MVTDLMGTRPGDVKARNADMGARPGWKAAGCHLKPALGAPDDFRTRVKRHYKTCRDCIQYALDL